MRRWNISSKNASKQTTSNLVSKAVSVVMRPLHTIKRGITSLFVCVVVLLPLFLIGMQLAHLFGFTMHDSRKATPLAAMQVRAVDAKAMNGNDAAINQTVRPFKEPLITVTFDDGWESVYTQAAPLLQKYGIPTTQYILSGVEDDKGYMSFAQLQALNKAGHEIACHSVNHPDLTTLSQNELMNQLTGCKSVLESKLHIQVTDFASPYGHNNDATIKAIKQTYRSQRNTDGDITTNQADSQDVNMANGFDRYNITAVTIRRETSDFELNAAIDYTVRNNGWLVLNYHDIDNDGSTFGLDSNVLDAQFAAISRSSVRVVTMGQVLNALDANAHTSKETAK